MRTAPALLTALCLTTCVAACGAGSGQTGGTGTSAKVDAGKFLAFSRCMRSHGVPNFPDPSSGGIQIRPGQGLNPQSPAFQAAGNICRKILPGGGPGARKPTKAEFTAGLTFARCMRSHGLPNFPDPLASAPAGSGPIIALQGMMFKPGPGFDPGSPAFQQAASHCGVRVPKPPG
jgi:hypothetical protein